MKIQGVSGTIGMFLAIILTALAARGQAVKVQSISIPNARPSSTLPVAVNVSGRVVGSFVSGAGATEGFLWNGFNGSSNIIIAPGSANYSRANGINDADTIVGDYYGKDGLFHGFIDNRGSFSQYDLPGFDGNNNKFSTSLFGISENGDLVGASNKGGTEEGFVAISGQVFTFYGSGNDITYAYGINDFGVAVGQFYDSKNLSHGFMWSGGVVTEIPYPEAAQTACVGINDSGEITGYYVDGAGNTHGFTDIGGTFVTTDMPLTLGVDSLGSYVGAYIAPMGVRLGYLAVPVDLNIVPVEVAKAQSTTIYGISAVGVPEMVGQYTNANGLVYGMALLDGKLTILNITDAIDNSTDCYGVALGSVVCGYTDSNGNSQAAVNYGQGFTKIVISGAVDTYCYGINTNGDLAGTFTDFFGTAHGFLLIPGSNGLTNQLVIQLDVPGATSTMAWGVNDTNQVSVTWIDSQGYAEASIYDYLSATYTSVNLPGATNVYAHGISNSGAVAFTGTDSSGGIHAGVYIQGVNANYYLFDFPGGSGARADGISDAGQIVGHYFPSESLNFQSFRASIR